MVFNHSWTNERPLLGKSGILDKLLSRFLMYKCISCFSPFTRRLHITVSSSFLSLHKLFSLRDPFPFLMFQHYRENFPTIREHTRTWDDGVDEPWKIGDIVENLNFCKREVVTGIDKKASLLNSTIIKKCKTLATPIVATTRMVEEPQILFPQSLMIFLLV